MSGESILNKRIRKNFGKLEKIVEIPDLIGMQKESYGRFLQLGIAPDKREDIGLQAIFKSVFPIKDFTESASLEFVAYAFGSVKHSVQECIQRGMTYEIPVRIRVRLVVYDVDADSGTSSIRDIKEQEIYFGAIPLMTNNGTFIINGTERVVVSQLHRSSGIFFDHDQGKTHSSGKVVYSTRIIPVRGSWIDMEIDPKDVVYVRIDRRRKFPATILFKALGYASQDILDYFYKKERIFLQGKKVFKAFNEESLRGQRASTRVKHPETGDIIVDKGRIFTKRVIRDLKSAKVDMVPIKPEDILESVIGSPVIDPQAGDVLAAAGEYISEDMLGRIRDAGIKEFDILFIDGVKSTDSMVKTLLLDKVDTKEESLIDIYKRVRPGNPATPEVAQDFIDHLFFKPDYYDLSTVGRLKLNHRLDTNASVHLRTLRKEDLLLAVKTLINLKNTQGAVDDIDHLGNRRVRAVGELLENQYRIGLVRMERAIKERMSLQEVDALMPHDLVNPKPVSAVVREFFGTSQLSQFMDQTNPLSETTHKRRLSALGPGGLTRERAGFEVRDVHPSHYGRICPIETPEGPNIGLIVSLSTYARVNDYGFIETPYRVVADATVSREIKMLPAFEEGEHPIAQANAPVDNKGRYVNPVVIARVEGEFSMINAGDVELMDVSPNQLVSVSASLIPFLENDDANRALMGSNMQRQSVPLAKPSAPLVGTGVERVVARDSGVAVVAEKSGRVMEVDAARIVIKHDESESGKPVTVYNLSKFIRSNQNTCFNHRPIVKKGQHVKPGDVIADGPATERGELALGKNVTVAFMPWGGYNFEDSILVGEPLVRDGVFTSVHIEEFEVVARDTKLGKEEITCDIPNVGEENLRDLDESGIVRLGAEVKPGDILVGKITPKGETQLSPEEKLLRAIFGEKGGNVKDTSLRVPPGVNGTVIDAKVFTRRGVDKDERTQQIENEEIEVLRRNRDDELAVIEEVAQEKVADLLVGEKCAAPVKKGKKVAIAKGDKITQEALADIPMAQLEKVAVESDAVNEKLNRIFEWYRDQKEDCREAFETRVSRYGAGEELPPGVIKMVKIYVAMKRVLSTGDKMAGRHGNKGVVSRILPQEDLPYFEDGTTVDMVLNPLGVPSRMNVGQILEIHLGRAAKSLGDQVEKMIEENNHKALKQKFKAVFDRDIPSSAIDGMDDDTLMAFAKSYRHGVHMETPVFDGAKEAEIKALLKEGGVSETGQAVLYDGRTGEPFDEKITVGIMYMLKLHHLVDDKLHARSIGPYSLVTQQPLGGKAQFGGQRLGEMEVWAMEAYGAAYALQEFLTVKSDDIAGRTRMYEKIVKGQNVLDPGLPESFKVLTKEMKGLGLDVTLIENKDEE
ncbi:MAG: DNA-directed RNA polymerase subunit beta [Thermodesulfobacteriota bacterium]|nr:DNA-directed RNA polymerase subunit beta [Thermodesulfobacteriota bacterium]